jgi:hypothetical protein
MKHRNLAIALACLLSAGLAQAFARKPPAQPPPTSSHPATLEQAVKQVQRQTRGHILAADTVTRGKTNMYRIKVLTPQGQVRVVQMRSTARTQPDPGKPGSDKSGSDQGGH